MTRLSVNINKVATLRNARGGNLPDVEQFAKDCERFGAQGITVHPRPDERHIRRPDVYALRNLITTEFNIEGNPQPAFVDLVCEVRPTQVTLVPDAEDQLTSNHGWDTKQHLAKLTALIQRFRREGIRVSVFVNADPEMVEYAKRAGADRVELYTGPFAELYDRDAAAAIEMIRPAAEKAHEIGIGLNAGHDLNLRNLQALITEFPWIDEVSIGHALIADALYLGIEETIRRYRACCIPAVD
ncbi:MAG: pyridoxine 5'-phosphate synthase [Paludibacteraceae bacterium]|nr:pyridoxine 5'-phosphate synthase [Paludibacteraceae bacterium]